ncbi:MAG: DUF2845 domain-containing protein [Rhizobacter sp.]|nr:DUF2845 domain-containing protein [Rhizobacter sp.]
MKALTLVLLATALVPAAPPAQAESLRCNGHSASEGDSRLSVLYKCGQPLLKDSHCAPVYQAQGIHPLPPHVAALFVPCQHIEEWLYDRGPGNLMATVRFRAGVVQSIVYARSPR